MFDDVITLFNKVYDSSLKDYLYVRTYLRGVNVDLKKAVNVIKSGLENANSGTIIIPEEVDAEGKEFFKPIKYRNLGIKKPLSVKDVNELTVQEMNEIVVALLSPDDPHWTLQEGDVIVLDLVDYDINGTDTIANLRKNYDDVYEITSVDTKLKGGLPHWEVGVK